MSRPGGDATLVRSEAEAEAPSSGVISGVPLDPLTDFQMSRGFAIILERHTLHQRYNFVQLRLGVIADILRFSFRC